MNYYSFIPLTAFLIVFFIFSSIVSIKEKTKFIKSLILLTFVVSILYIIDFINWSLIFNKYITLRLKIASILWISLGFLYLNTIYSFINKKKDIIYFIIFLFTLIVILISLFTDKIIYGYKIYFWGVDILPGILQQRHCIHGYS